MFRGFSHDPKINHMTYIAEVRKVLSSLPKDTAKQIDASREIEKIMIDVIDVTYINENNVEFEVREKLKKMIDIHTNYFANPGGAFYYPEYNCLWFSYDNSLIIQKLINVFTWTITNMCPDGTEMDTAERMNTCKLSWLLHKTFLKESIEFSHIPPVEFPVEYDIFNLFGIISKPRQVNFISKWLDNNQQRILRRIELQADKIEIYYNYYAPRDFRTQPVINAIPLTTATVSTTPIASAVVLSNLPAGHLNAPPPLNLTPLHI